MERGWGQESPGVARRLLIIIKYMNLTSGLIRQKLRQNMIDPELGMNVVDLGLIYKININKNNKVYIRMTLTTPGCPLAAVFMPMIRQALSDISGFDPYNDLEVEITFDPPWHPGLMTERAKAEMGL